MAPQEPDGRRSNQRIDLPECASTRASSGATEKQTCDDRLSSPDMEYATMFARFGESQKYAVCFVVSDCFIARPLALIAMTGNQKRAAKTQKACGSGKSNRTSSESRRYKCTDLSGLAKIERDTV